MTKKELQAILNTFYYQNSGSIRGVCPKCGKYMLIDGYVCYGCHYDPTDE